MNAASTGARSLVQRARSSPVGIVATALFVLGMVLAITVHKGFMVLAVLGAFGPGVLRQLGWLDDLDEFQKEAAAKSGLRAYLAGGVILLAAVIGGGWDTTSVGSEMVSAMPVASAMLVVYYASYCLSFWDARRAVSRVLAAFGVLWLVFVVLSHATEPVPLILEALTVPVPFFAAAVLCWRWPRVVGALLLAACVGSVFLFRMLPFGETSPERIARAALMLTLIPLPLAVGGVALLTWRRTD